jgi:hypothetical protein
LRLHQYSVPNLEFSDILSYSSNFACRFMSKDQGLFHNIDSIPSVLEVVHVGAADSCSSNADLHLVIFWWRGDAIFDAEVLGPVEDGTFMRFCQSHE